MTNMQEKEGWYELSPIRELLNMQAADGKQRATDAADTETLLRIIQSVPFPKAEPVKQWLTRIVAHYDQIPEALAGGLRLAHSSSRHRRETPQALSAPRWRWQCLGATAWRGPSCPRLLEQVVLDFLGYGYRRVTCALQRAGWVVNHKRVLRVMREEALLYQLQRHFGVPTTTDATHGYRTYPNLLVPLTLDHLDQAWVADLTYIRLPMCFVYLACVLDAYSRRVVGWHLSRGIDTALTLAALEHALATRQPPPGWIHHSERGVQYANSAYVARLEQAGAQVSMAAKGNPYDNAKAESFFKTLKHEDVYLNEYTTFAKANLAHFIEDVYNAKRLHSSLRLSFHPRWSGKWGAAHFLAGGVVAGSNDWASMELGGACCRFCRDFWF